MKRVEEVCSPVEVVDVVERRRLSEAHPSLPDVLTAVDGLNVLSGVLEKYDSSFTATANNCCLAGCGDASLLSNVVERDETLLLELKETKTDI